MKLRIAEPDWLSLRERLFARKDVESAAILLGYPHGSGDHETVAIREVHLLEDSAYRIRKRDQLSLDPVALNRITRRARQRGWSVFTVHTHPGATEPWFSAADDAGDSRFMPALHCQIPSAPHGSIVIVENGRAVARYFDAHAAAHEIPLVIVGRTIAQSPTSTTAGEPWFARQELALGASGQARLRSLRAGVVGLGGTGSIVAIQLAHLGVGSLVLMDRDRIEATNLSRVVGATKADIGELKVEVAARYLRALDLGSQVECHPEALVPTNAALLAGCDVVVSCVDRHAPRAVLNRMAYESLVPTIDIGTAFRVNERGIMIGDAGRVVVVGPGRPCLACWGHLDPHAMRIEALTKAERTELEGAGYIDGASEPQPSVIAFNTAVAGSAIIELLRIVTTFAGFNDPPTRLAFSFSSGTVRRNALAPVPSCTICGAARAVDWSGTTLAATR